MVKIDVGVVRAGLNRLCDAKGNVREEVAEELVADSIWWLTHSSGHPVRAPKFAARVERGRLELGANIFDVAGAIKRCRQAVLNFVAKVEKGQAPSQDELEKTLVAAIRSSVISTTGNAYKSYPAPDGEMVFGAHAISIDDFIKQLYRRVGLVRSVPRTSSNSGGCATGGANPPNKGPVLPGPTASCPHCPAKPNLDNLARHLRRVHSL